MLRWYGLIGLLSLLAATSSGAVSAQEYLATDEIPASLRQAGVQPDQVLTATAAKQVRGGVILFPSQGVVINVVGASNYVPNAVTVFRANGGGETVLIGINQGQLFFSTQGTALLGNTSTIQGIVASQTSNFVGYVAFQGNPSSAQIVAYPNVLSIRLR